MKLVTFKKDTKVPCGVLTNKGIVDLTGSFRSVKQILAGGFENTEKIQIIVNKCTKFIDPSAVELLAPIPEPGTAALLVAGMLGLARARSKRRKIIRGT